MDERFKPVIDLVVSSLELAGVAVIVVGFMVATAHWLAWFRRQSTHASYVHYRRRSVRGLILGLEFLVAADIIKTVTMDYSVESLLELALIVLIRTFLVFALHLEIDGHLPWQRRPARGAAPPP